MAAESIFTNSSNSFEGKYEDEETIAVYRAHWFILVKQGIIALTALSPIMLLFFASIYFQSPLLQRFLFFIACFYVLFWWYKVFYIASMYYLNSWIMTDNRLIESDTLGFFRRNYTEFHVSKIQDVSVEVNGLLATLLDFGNIVVESAGAVNKLRLINVPNPLAVKDIIMKANAKYLKVHKPGPHHIVAEDYAIDADNKTHHLIKSQDFPLALNGNIFVSENLELERIMNWTQYDGNKEIEYFVKQKIRFLKPEKIWPPLNSADLGKSAELPN